ncbi:hypothetical protein IC575_004626 [Cucumis melo]
MLVLAPACLFHFTEGRGTMILSVLSSPALVFSLMVVRAKNSIHSILFPIPVFPLQEIFFILDNESIPLLPTQRNTTSLRYTVYAKKVRSLTNLETLDNLLYTYYSV